jgi:hypothetical protein
MMLAQQLTGPAAVETVERRLHIKMPYNMGYPIHMRRNAPTIHHLTLTPLSYACGDECK